MTPNHWGAMLRYAARMYSIKPAEFWSLSVWEWQQLMGESRMDNVNRKQLDLLMRQYPDQQSKKVKT